MRLSIVFGKFAFKKRLCWPLQKLVPCLLFIFTLSISLQEQSVAASQNGMVVTEGAIVYRKADFDSDVIGYFPAGKRVTVSTKHFGAFYRVVFKQGVVGYISDVDVKTAKGSESRSEKKSKAKKADSEDDSEDNSEEKQEKVNQKTQLFKAVSIGPALGYIAFREVYGQSEYQDSMLFYGAKLNLPFSLLGGLFFLDVTGLYHSGAPAYYTDLSQIPPTGRVILGEQSLYFALSQYTKPGWIYAGVGLMESYSDFVIQVRGSQQAIQEFRMGASFTVGASYSMGSFMLKIEPKYYLEKAKYWGVVGALQYVF